MLKFCDCDDDDVNYDDGHDDGDDNGDDSDNNDYYCS